MDKISIVIYYIIGSSILWYLLNSRYRFLNSNKCKLLILLSYLFIAVVTIFSRKPHVVIPISILFISVFLIHDTWINRFINVLYADLALSLADDFVSILIISLSNSLNIDRYRPFCIVLGGAFILLIYRTNFFQQIVNNSVDIAFWKKVLTLIVMILMLNLLSFGESLIIPGEGNVFERVYLIMSELMMLSTLSVVTLLYLEMYRKSIFKQNAEIKETVISEQQAVYNLLVEKNEDTRQFRHDIGNNLEVVYILLNKGKIQEAIAYLNQMITENNSLRMKSVFYGNEIIDSVMSMVYWRAKQKGIEMQISGNMCVNSENVYELCCILSNAVSNAIEACECIGTVGPVYVKSYQTESMIVISIVNPASEEMYDNLMEGKTQKSDKMNHGYGVSCIKKAVNRLNGDIVYKYLDNKVELLISIAS